MKKLSTSHLLLVLGFILVTSAMDIASENGCTYHQDASCHANAKCTEIDGDEHNWVCNCTNGLVGDGLKGDDHTGCGPKTCRFTTDCHSHATCNAFAECECKAGFIGEGMFQCEDVNECHMAPCHPHAVCLNTYGSYKCTCMEEQGWVGDGFTCEHTCNMDYECGNTAKWKCKDRVCICNSGYTMGDHDCIDIDECLDKNACSSHANCTNEEGTFVCTCKNGFTGEGQSCDRIPENCHDIKIRQPKARSGTYEIDTDGDGPRPAVQIECEMRDDVGITIIKPDITDRVRIKERQPNFEYTYAHTMDDIKAIIDTAGYCYQTMSYKCVGGGILMDDDYWINGLGEKEYNWAGSVVTGKCPCGQMHSCTDPASACNCNGSLDKNIDEGKIIDKERLPILGVYAPPGDQGSGFVTIGSLMCAPKPVDIPIDCHDAKVNTLYNVKKDGPLVVDFDGSEGRLSPVLVYCDMETYRHTGVTTIPTEHPQPVPVHSSDIQQIKYSVDILQLNKLVEISEFCLQEAEYECTNSRLLNGHGHFSDISGNEKSYWPGGMGRANMCGCGLLNSCESADVNCNCDIMDGKTRKDIGIVTDKQDLPIGSLKFKDINDHSTGTYHIGSLKCSRREFGILPTCQEYVENGHTYSYTYLIDPDGPHRPNKDNQPPFPVFCRIEGEPLYATTVVYHETKGVMPVSSEHLFTYNYVLVTLKQISVLKSRSVSCTQNVKYTCTNAPLHGEHGWVKWLTQSGREETYFAGDGKDWNACVCGLSEPSSCVGGGYCNCDVEDDTERVDEGQITNMNDLPILKMQFVKLLGSSGASIQVGPLECRALYPNCADKRNMNRRTVLESENYMQDGEIVIDPDGPGGVEPFTVTCKNSKTSVDVTISSVDPIFGEPSVGVTKCYDVGYTSKGVPVSKDQVQALVANSKHCAQSLFQECQNAPLTGHTTYKTCDGVEHSEWVGGNAEHTCACGVVGTCAGGSEAHCNCDLEDGKTRRDGGWLVKALAVCQVCVSLDPTETLDGNNKGRRVRPVISELFCDKRPLGVGQSCQTWRDNNEAESGPVWIDVDGHGPIQPFPVNCILSSYPPAGWSEMKPKNGEIEVPETGVDINIEYYVYNIEYIQALIEKSQYCTQEILLECHGTFSGFSWNSWNGTTLTYLGGNEEGQTGCAGGQCVCSNGELRGTITDDTLLPVSHIVIGPGTGTRKLTIGPLKCFDIYRDCDDIWRNKAWGNPMGDQTYTVDPDQGGVVPFFPVVCEFRNKIMGITHISIEKPTAKDRNVKHSYNPGETEIPLHYGDVSVDQIQALAKISGYCYQDLHFLCKRTPLINSNDPIGSYYKTANGSISYSYGVPGSSSTVGCSCMSTKTCPKGHSCHCDALDAKATIEYGYEIDRSRLPITTMNIGSQVGPDSWAYFDISSLHCAPVPFDLPKDCHEVYKLGKRSGEHLIFPSTEVEPYLVYCNMEIVEDDGVAVIGNNLEVGINVTFDSKISVSYHSADKAQIQALVAISTYCYQSFIYECRNTKLLTGEGYFYWKGGASDAEQRFVGTGNHVNGQCNCGSDGYCAGSEDMLTLAALDRPCNCDAADGELRADAGVFSDKSRLPIHEMQFSNPGIPGAHGHVKLGKLYCSQKDYDIDECTTGYHDCHKKAKCINTPGSYECHCRPGWRGYGVKPRVWTNGRNCIDDDECAMNKCPDGADCTNLPGTYECKCGAGYIQLSPHKCKDIDECAMETDNCDVNAYCFNLHGSYSCRCKRNFRGDGVTCTPLAVCSCFGDPHCITYDEVLVDYQGTCQYVMSRDNCDGSAPPTFQLLTTHYRKDIQALPDASWVKEVTLKVYDYTISLMQGYEVFVNREKVCLPIRLGDNIEIRKSGAHVYVYTKLGLEFTWDGEQAVEIFTPGQYANNTCGLCGNYNNNPADDIMVGPACQDSTGSITDNFNLFGTSWVEQSYVEEHPYCAANCSVDGDSGMCTGDKYIVAVYQCNALFGTHGRFKECRARVGETIFEQYKVACIYDLCRLEDDVKYGICPIAQSFFDVCMKAGAQIKNYRTETFCSMDCGANMEFSLCGTLHSQQTCLEIMTSTTMTDTTTDCQQGCFCKEGFVLEDDKCVHPEDCGCIHNDMYYKVGDTITSTGCLKKKECLADHTFSTDDIQCPENAICTIKYGYHGCHCKEGYFGDALVSCHEDPCLDSPCGDRETCIRDLSLADNYLCECSDGYMGDCGNCSDIDECLTGTSGCSAHATCINTEGSFKCICKPGFTMNSNMCIDDDECGMAYSAQKTICGDNSKCSNRPGGYECLCCDGYRLNGKGDCVATKSAVMGAKCCICDEPYCDEPGKVCGTDGVQYSSIREMIISNCEQDLHPIDHVTVDYLGRCKKSCQQTTCPKYQTCVTDEAGYPTCVCADCIPEDSLPSPPVCSSKLVEYPNTCVFKKVECRFNLVDDMLPDIIPCEKKDGVFPVGPWTEWSPCSVSCGRGTSAKSREAIKPNAGDFYPLELTTECFKDPCPDSPCATKWCEVAQECVVNENNEPVCECLKCENVGVEPVCGYMTGTKHPVPGTFMSACHLQKEACEKHAKDYEVMHEGHCGKVSLVCAKVPKLEFVHDDEGYTSEWKVNKFDCEGGCGLDKDYCCQAIETKTVPVTMVNQNTTPKKKHTEVEVIKECACVEI